MKKFLAMAMSVVLGASTILPAFAEEVKAVPSPQKIYINGEAVDIKAFNIDGRNYFMLQDLGTKLNFGVEFDKATNSVKIMPNGAVKPAEPAKPVKPAEETMTLKGWEGTWNSIGLYLDEKELDSAFEAKGKKEGKTAAEIKQGKKDVYATEVNSMVISGDTIKFYDTKLMKEGGEGKATAEETYKFAGNVKFGKGMWATFESTAADSKHKYLMMTSAHGDDMMHFHIRFGNESFEKLQEQKAYPTYIKYDTKIETLKEEMME